MHFAAAHESVAGTYATFPYGGRKAGISPKPDIAGLLSLLVYEFTPQLCARLAASTRATGGGSRRVPWGICGRQGVPSATMSVSARALRPGGSGLSSPRASETSIVSRP